MGSYTFTRHESQTCPQILCMNKIIHSILWLSGHRSYVPSTHPCRIGIWDISEKKIYCTAGVKGEGKSRGRGGGGGWDYGVEEELPIIYNNQTWIISQFNKSWAWLWLDKAIIETSNDQGNRYKEWYMQGFIIWILHLTHYCKSLHKLVYLNYTWVASFIHLLLMLNLSLTVCLAQCAVVFNKVTGHNHLVNF
jgi:hypothetical protein